MTHLVSSDLQLLLSVLPDVYAATSLTDLPRRVIRAVTTLVPADLVGYDHIDLRTGRIDSFSDPVDAQLQSLLPAFAEHHLDHPSMADYQRTGDGRAWLISDFLPASRWERTALFGEFFSPLRLHDQLAIALTRPTPNIVVAIALNRHCRNFTDRDKRILDLARPHLQQAYRVASRLDLITDMRATLALADLTHRELEICRLLPLGLSNKQIADRLDRSPKTVGKHLENIYRKLNVTTRAAAAMAVRDATPRPQC